MNRRILYVLAVLLITTLACNLLSGKRTPTPTIPPTTSPQKEVTVDVKNTPSVPATEVPVEQASPTTEAATVAPSATKPPAPTATLAAASISSPLVIGNLQNDPAQLSVIDPLTGQIKQSFSAPGLAAASPAYATTDALFYLDSGFKIVRWAGYDGSKGELGFMNPGSDIFYGYMLPSPDGKRIAWAVIADQTGDSNHNQLKIANKDGSGEKLLVDETSTPPVAWVPIAWSPDGEWLYFASQPWGIGGYILYNGVMDVRRVPLKGGEAEIVLPTLNQMADVAISPDFNTLAYIHSIPSADGSTYSMELILLKIGTIKMRTVKLPADYLQAGAITWSPDSQSLVVSLAVGNYDTEAYSLMQIDAGALATKMLFTKDKNLLQPVTWPVAGSLWLKDTNGNAWSLDLPGGALTQAAADQTVLPNGWH